jgi:hypothetical protein
VLLDEAQGPLGDLDRGVHGHAVEHADRRAAEQRGRARGGLGQCRGVQHEHAGASEPVDLRR